ncbi:GNAT family N-acetyltransferase [Salinimicrobium sediminilitoris]|uniref:GNAT family N-acetyltransferase n=1 Tax=Salinimicrobium sediminilitoris TaxID=2876715 RepID=UPI001E4D2D85|nr:GNAT family N-acetyltransferase [Salinimicrobium sediminilitoris]MCC8358736.1 GNAT family N-acetyltransferase [Salinimicrobium sediminilitoris]
MVIRKATETDIPEILKVLKASLGETSSRKTKDVWKFKHVNNPFGKSLVLIALEGDAVIGVRAFMRWKWQRGEKVYSCFRAVDTATHPDHQGKGIFKKLTLEAIKIAKVEGGNFIFNTPNDQSLPGYLKMNWKEVGKLKVTISPTSPFLWFKKVNIKYDIIRLAGKEDLNNLCAGKNFNISREGTEFFTPKTMEYLFWRYENNPLQQYEVFSDNGLYLAGYIKIRNYSRELRISEIIVSDDAKLTKARKMVKAWANKFGATVISAAEDHELYSKLKFSGGYGPVMTVRKLNLSSNEDEETKELNNYRYSLGDLELF